MKNQKNPLGRKDEIVVQEMDGEVLIYDLKDDKAFCLNETSSLIWEMCDGKHSVSEISKGLSQKLNSPVSEDLVWLAIEQLKKEKLIANSKELVSNFEGMNRREVIKKVGLASMIALPIVTGMVAPTPVMAASAGSLGSGAPLGSATTAGDDCGGDAASQADRTAGCQATYGGATSPCMSMMATFTPGTCTFMAGPMTSTYDCECV